MAIRARQELIRQRFQGALIGALVGDCYGAPFEHKKVANPTTLMDNIEELSKQRTLYYTDDTCMSISTCKSLLERKGFDAHHLAREFSESYFREPKRGYGPAVRTVFKKLKKEDYQRPFEPAASQFEGQGSFGNGAAMRCIGVGLFAYKQSMGDKSAVELSESCAKLTHTHIHGVNGATLLVLAVRYVLRLDENELDDIGFVDYLIDKMVDLEDENDRIYSKKLDSIKKVLQNLNVSGTDVDQREIVRLLGNDVAAQNSVPLAIYSFIRGNSKFTDLYGIDNEFSRTLHWAISCGGDTDTIASMACGLCGAYLGIDKIPEHLYKVCEGWQDIKGYADQMLPFDPPQRTVTDEDE